MLGVIAEEEEEEVADGAAGECLSIGLLRLALCLSARCRLSLGTTLVSFGQYKGKSFA